MCGHSDRAERNAIARALGRATNPRELERECIAYFLDAFARELRNGRVGSDEDDGPGRRAYAAECIESLVTMIRADLHHEGQ